MTRLLFIPLLLLLAAGFLEAPAHQDTWSPASWQHPLGTDEFGRDLLRVLLISTGRSTLFGALLSAMAVTLATLTAAATTLQAFPPVAAAIRLVTQAVESVPIFLWVLAAFASYRTHSTTIIPIAFLLAVLPISTHVLRGEFERLSREPYMDAAKLSGVSLLRLFTAYYLPNAQAVLVPLGIQLFGIAISIRGAIRVLGFSTRADCDLGILLRRGFVRRGG